MTWYLHSPTARVVWLDVGVPPPGPDYVLQDEPDRTIYAIKPEKVRVSVFWLGASEYEPPIPFTDFIAELQSALDAVPEEYRPLARWESRYDYDAGTNYEAWYDRPKTPEELESEKRERLEAKVRDDRQEYERFLKLKTKYEERDR